MKQYEKGLVIITVISLLVLIGCASQQEINPSPTPLRVIATAKPLIETPLATSTTLPTTIPSETPTLTPTATSTSSPTPSSTLLPTKILPSPTQQQTKSTVAPTTSSNYDGDWNGTTSQGKPIKLKIKNNTIVEFSVEFDPAVCSSAMMGDFEPKSLTGNSFEKAFTFGATRLLVVSGSISANGKMTGLITAEKNLLCESTSLQWSASR